MVSPLVSVLSDEDNNRLIDEIVIESDFQDMAEYLLLLMEQ